MVTLISEISGVLEYLTLNPGGIMPFVVKVSSLVSRSNDPLIVKLAGNTMLTDPGSITFSKKSPIILTRVFHPEYPEVEIFLPVKTLGGQDYVSSRFIKGAKSLKTPKDLSDFKKEWLEIHSVLSAFPA